MLLSTSLLALGLSAAGADASFLEASSEQENGAGPSNAYNAVDGKPGTAWCAKPSDETPALSFGFPEAVTITHITLLPGATKDAGGTPALDKAKKRARIVYLVDNDHRVEAKFKDDAAPQTLELSPPVRGKLVVVEFAGVYDGAPDGPLCIAELSLKGKEGLLVGPALATKARALSSSARRVLRAWIDDVAAPQRSLLLDADGTFTYKFEPLLEGKPAKLRGKWSATERSITFELGSKSFRAESRLTRIDEGDTHTVELSLSGDVPHPSMAAKFRPAPARLP